MSKTKAVPSPAEISLVETDYQTLESLTTEQLREELAQGLRVTAECLSRLAAVVRILEERGEDLSELRIGLIGYLRRIAHGQVLPEVVVRFADSPMLLRRIASLPLPDQKRLAEGEPVKLVVPQEGGPADHRMADPLRMTRDQITLVFAADHIRDTAEQLLVVQDRRSKPVAKRLRDQRRVRPDRDRGGIVIGRAFAAQAEAVAALADLASPEDESERDKALVVKLTKAEHAKLWQAAGPGKSMTELARQAMRAMGVI